MKNWGEAYLTILIILLALSGGVYAQETPDSTTWCVSAWYPSSEDNSDESGGFAVLMQEADLMHVVNPFWYSTRADGSLVTLPHAEDADELAALRDAGYTIMPAIFTGISAMIETPEARTDHIAQIVDLVLRMDYDGIDIDYEAFHPNTREAFSLFIEELADALHAHDKWLSIAVHAKTDDAGAWGGAAAQDWPRLTAAVDVFRIMTYDYHNRNEPPGPIGPPQWSLDVLDYAEQVTDLSKVRLGLHFYGYSWQRGTPPATTITWQSAQRYITSFQPELQRDPDDMELFIDLKVPGLPRQTIYLADAEGIAYKLQQVRAAYPALGGVSIWGIGGEDPAIWDVLREMAQGDCPYDAGRSNP